MRRQSDDGGAILILALVVVTVLAALTAAVAEFGFDAPHAARADVDRDRVVAALDLGMDAAVENTREGLSSPCTDEPLELDGVTGTSAGPPVDVVVTCEADGGSTTTFLLHATAYSSGSGCSGSSPDDELSLSPSLDAKAYYPSAGSQHPPTVLDWSEAATAPCAAEPHG